MVLFITNKCVNCGICELECPNHAISMNSNNIYEINKKHCTECIGFYKKPACQDICPISNAIIKIPTI